MEKSRLERVYTIGIRHSELHKTLHFKNIESELLKNKTNLHKDYIIPISNRIFMGERLLLTTDYFPGN